MTTREDHIARRLRADLEHKVRTYGRAVMWIFPADDSADPLNDTFAYTVGNAPKLPELLVIGMQDKNAKWVLNAASDALAKTLAAAGPIPPQGMALDLGGKCPVYLVPASDEAKKDMTFAATNWHGGTDYPLMQVVMPDQHGRFPWHDDCDWPYGRVRLWGPAPVAH